jgi:hypothetical protein
VQAAWLLKARQRRIGWLIRMACWESSSRSIVDTWHRLRKHTMCSAAVIHVCLPLCGCI